jgi:flagellar motor switch protein FliM
MTLLRVTTDGGRTREAVASMEADGAALGAAFRKALPFLSKPGFHVTFASATASLLSEVLATLGGPAYTACFDVVPGGSMGVVVFDRALIALLVEGLLGGGQPVEIGAGRLSVAQKALMARVSSAVLGEMSAVLKRRAGIQLAFDPQREDVPCDAGYVVSSWDIGVEGRTGRAVLALARDAAVTRVRFDEVAESAPDPRVESALRKVELDLVVELGRAKVSLTELAKLRVGSTLLVETQVGGAVTVRADGRPILTGEPTTSDGRIAVRVRQLGHDP